MTVIYRIPDTETTEEPAEALDVDATDQPAAFVPGHTGEDFELDLTRSATPVIMFALLGGLAGLMAVAAPVLGVQITAGLVAVLAAVGAVRSLRRRH